MTATSSDRPTAVFAFAHPDDESFGTGGTIALLADRGVAVHIVLATDGAGGVIVDPVLDTPANRSRLGEIRRQEALAAAHALGAAGLRFLGYPDGAVAASGPERLRDAILAELEVLRPVLVVSFGPDGIYGHPDHVAVSRAASDAFEAWRDRPPGARLLYNVIPADLAEQLNADSGPVVLDGVDHPFTGYHEDEIDIRVRVGEVVERKLAALELHRTQTATRLQELSERFTADQSPVECFRLAAGDPVPSGKHGDPLDRLPLAPVEP